jgi:hypothetical protein
LVSQNKVTIKLLPFVEKSKILIYKKTDNDIKNTGSQNVDKEKIDTVVNKYEKNIEAIFSPQFKFTIDEASQSSSKLDDTPSQIPGGKRFGKSKKNMKKISYKLTRNLRK